MAFFRVFIELRHVAKELSQFYQLAAQPGSAGGHELTKRSN